METRADTGEGKGTCPPLRLFRGVMLPPEFCPSPLSSSGGDCNFVPPLSGSGGGQIFFKFNISQIDFSKQKGMIYTNIPI